MIHDPDNSASGPVVFAYDGSALAKLAIEEAGRQLTEGRDALVLTVWQPFDVGFVPAVELRINAAEIADVRNAAEQTAAEGASLAQAPEPAPDLRRGRNKLPSRHLPAPPQRSGSQGSLAATDTRVITPARGRNLLSKQPEVMIAGVGISDWVDGHVRGCGVESGARR